jgi:Zn finger protein HypA/HybF involved in hydrogenase expression
MSSSKKNTGCMIGAVIGLIIAALLVLFGVLYVIASSGPEATSSWFTQGLIMIVIGLVAVGASVFVLIKMRPQPPQEIIQKVDVTGDVAIAKLKCKNCGADLDKDSISVKEGAIFVNCPYCRSTYQIVEEPKW